ncbi:MAG TPA: UDP-N-acetylglucosamine 4,6-dehydratase (inverting) [Candidatus Rubrimentiphilum sp.]|nr:UDP-N-acetylglucosamine 4,6-dehydratase (inverting) [Candidatus Rubrimentiphilum sp.]
MFDGHSLLITGGTGSFGRAFVATMLARHKPREIIVYSRDEQKQYEMRHAVAREGVRYVLGDVRDRERLTRASQGVDIIVHAAALKQVPTAEHNPIEAVKTNILGAQNVIFAAIDNKAARVLALSTDKAVNPINLYGATKLVADKLFVAANSSSEAGQTMFSVVRYGNVFTSRGSVVPYFQKLLAEGAQKLPITDLRMTRFWITLQAGADFVLDCLGRMQGGEIFVPRIPSVRMIDVAKAIAPELDIEITGIRPGEKLHETLCPKDEAHLTLRFAKHFVVRPSIAMPPGREYQVDALGERGSAVEEGFEYTSESNEHFLTVEELRRQFVATG